MDERVRTDALVSEHDARDLKQEINRGDFKRLVYELIAREPELAIALSEKYNLILTILEGAELPIKQKQRAEKQLSLAIWMPLLLLDRAHRRSWKDFLPSEEVIDGSDEEGGAQ